MLDLGHFDLSVDDGRRTLLGYAMEHADNYVKQPIPVVRLSDPDLALQDAATAGDGANGASVRLSAEDLDVDPDELNDNLDLVFRKVGLDRTAVDLVLDLGAISSDLAVVGGARLVIAVLRELDGVNDFRTVTVSSGAFPPGLSDLSAWTLGEYPRDDAALYNRVSRRPHGREISFGDYTIAHPLLSTNAPFSPAPQLRYTVADRWLTLKGRKNDPRGNSQFFDVCATIAAHPAFVGSDPGAADRRIFEGVSGGHGPGKACPYTPPVGHEVWREGRKPCFDDQDGAVNHSAVQLYLPSESAQPIAITFDLVAADLAVDGRNVHSRLAEADPEFIPDQRVRFGCMLDLQASLHRKPDLVLKHPISVWATGRTTR